MPISVVSVVAGGVVVAGGGGGDKASSVGCGGSSAIASEIPGVVVIALIDIGRLVAQNIGEQTAAAERREDRA